MTNVNEDSSVINKLGASLTDDARVVVYDRHMFIVQATGPRYLSVEAAIEDVEGKKLRTCLV
jgi:hypothetical protein